MSTNTSLIVFIDVEKHFLQIKIQCCRRD